MVDDSVCGSSRYRGITFGICSVVSDYSVFVYSVLRVTTMMLD